MLFLMAAATLLGQLQTPNERVCSTVEGVEFKIQGKKYYEELNATTASDCCDKCSDDAKCHAYSFKADDVPKGISCKLLQAAPTIQKNDKDFVSGLIIQPTPPPTPPAPTPPPSPPKPAPKKWNGVTYASWETAGSDSFDSDTSDASIANAAGSGINSVAICQTYYQDNQNSTTISANDGKTNTDTGLRRAIQTARVQGLRVAIKPHVDFLNDDDHWRGQIGPAFDEGQWAQWFASYTDYMTHMAELALEVKADLFVVGTELITTEGREKEWRQLISTLRNATDHSIKFVYGANWSPGPTNVAWWDALDYIGVDAYYPLASKPNASVAALVAAWHAAPSVPTLPPTPAPAPTPPTPVPPPSPPSCTDVAPAPGTYTCAQQKSWGKCDTSANPWMKGFW